MIAICLWMLMTLQLKVKGCAACKRWNSKRLKHSLIQRRQFTGKYSECCTSKEKIGAPPWPLLRKNRKKISLCFCHLCQTVVYQAATIAAASNLFLFNYSRIQHQKLLPHAYIQSLPESPQQQRNTHTHRAARSPECVSVCICVLCVSGCVSECASVSVSVCCCVCISVYLSVYICVNMKVVSLMHSSVCLCGQTFDL